MSDSQAGASPELSMLLSHVLIAFTIEFDNEAEHRIPHRTTARRSAGDTGEGPWLVSLAMWSHFLRFVDDDGMTVREFCRRSHLGKAEARTWLTRIAKWWGYIGVGPHAEWNGRTSVGGDWIVRPTAGGLRARRVWRTLFEVIEGRWRLRFGAQGIARLRDSLGTIVAASGMELPSYLPILSHGLRARTHKWRSTEAPASDVRAHPLPTLLAQTLLLLTIEFERESEISLALSANALRVITESGVRVRDIPALSGVSKEAVAASVAFLKRAAYVVDGSDAADRKARMVRLITKGLEAKSAYPRLLRAIEDVWKVRFGPDTIEKLRASLRAIVDARDGDAWKLAEGLRPYPDGWRARKPFLTQTDAMVRDPTGALPHYPIVLHRGGWPDGS